jgi:mandelamide amidase
MGDHPELTAVAAAATIRRGEMTAEAYVGGLLAQNERLRHLEALSWIEPERVREAARAVDLARARGEALRPLAGLPIVVKDNIDTLGFPTSAGTAGLKGLMPRADAPVFAALQSAGAILFGKANMHELAGGGTSSNPAFGFVRNPYDPARTPGGSSGGTAAALAARIAPAGLGTDTAGSVRIPSALSGTAGLRPTIAGPRKLYSDAGVVPLVADLDTVGPMARTMEDVALLHAAITGQTVNPVTLPGLRIGIPRGFHWDHIDADVEAVTTAALRRLSDAGAILVDIDCAGLVEAVESVFGTLLRNGFNTDLAAYLAANGPPFDAAPVIEAIQSRDTRALFRLSRETVFAPGAVEAARTTQRAAIQERYRSLFKTHGIAAIAFPTVPLTAPPIPAAGDSFEDEVIVAGRPENKVMILIRNTCIACGLGAPGISLPAGLAPDGLPVGLEFDGLPGDDAALLGLGIAAEVAIGRLPPPALAQTG